MTYAITLYDALTGINVPRDRALAVVGALEQAMMSDLATKSDLASVRPEIEQLRLGTRADRSRAVVVLVVVLGSMVVGAMGLLFAMLQVTLG